MLLTINEILKRKNKRITKENLFEQKREILFTIVDDEFGVKYTEKVLKDTKSVFYVYYIGDNIENKDELCGICIVRLINNTKKIRSNVMTLLCIRNDLRGSGYGSTLLKIIMNKVKPKNSKKENFLYIHSLESSVKFYKLHGFEETTYICDYMYILEEEVYNDDIILLKIL
jgi:predicted GNAT family N-acyltransferase